MRTASVCEHTHRLDLKVTIARVVLLVLIGAGIAFRVAGLGWGIPIAVPPDATSCRNSFHLDEDDYLLGVTKIKARAWNFDVQDYHWGTLQFYLIDCALKSASLAGYLSRPWQDSFLRWNANEFARVYMTGRAVSALAGILSLFLVFRIGKLLRNVETGLMAAAFLAIAPLHVVNSHFLTADITMVCLLLGAFYFFLSSLNQDGMKRRLLSGILLGLAVAAKYNAVCLLPLWIGRDLIQRRTPWRTRVAGHLAFVAGFALGEPYAFIRPAAIADVVYRGLERTEVMKPFLLPWHRLLFDQAWAVAQYGLGWTLAVAAAIGVFWWFLRLSPKNLALAVSVILISVSLVAAKWPMVRYALPLIPIGALAAALFLTDLPIPEFGRISVGVLVAVLPISVSWAQVQILIREHPANTAARWIQANIPPGSRIGQIWREVPPLDGQRFNLHTMRGLFPGDPAQPEDLDRDYLILDNLPIQPFAGDFMNRLARDYVLLAEFRSTPRIGPWILGESWAPHDWKYTHPDVRVYGRTTSAVHPGSVFESGSSLFPDCSANRVAQPAGYGFSGQFLSIWSSR